MLKIISSRKYEWLLEERLRLQEEVLNLKQDIDDLEERISVQEVYYKEQADKQQKKYDLLLHESRQLQEDYESYGDDLDIQKKLVKRYVDDAAFIDKVCKEYGIEIYPGNREWIKDGVVMKLGNQSGTL